MDSAVDEEIKEAIAELEKITADPETRELYYQREKDLRDKIWGYRSERKAGVKEGLEKGRAEEKEEIIKSMYKKGITIQDISEIVRLSKEEVQKILKP